MSNTLTNFIVGMGYRYDRRGEAEIVSGIGSIKSQVLQLGSIVAGGYGVKQLTVDFANSRAELGEFSKTFGVLPEDVAALGQALTREGGSLDSFIGQLENVERLRAGLIRGDAAFIGQAGRAGLDVQPLIDAQNATEAYIALADQFAQLSQDQRLNAAEAIGLDVSSIRLLSNGGARLREIITEQKNLRVVTTEMTEVGKEFRNTLGELSDRSGGFADQISSKLLPAMTQLINSTNEWLQLNEAELGSSLLQLLDQLGVPVELPTDERGFPTPNAEWSDSDTQGLIGGMRQIPTNPFDWQSRDVEQLTGLELPEWLFTPVGDLFGGDTPEASMTAPIPNAMQPMTGNDVGAQIRALGGIASVSRPINVTLELDGQVLDKRIINTMGDLATDTIGDLSSGMEY